MKKKIIIIVFSLLILITAIIFIVSAISSYNYDIKNLSEDKWTGFATAIILMIGGFTVFYEFDLFYTVYYFLIKPKTKARTILNIFSNLTLFLIYFSDSAAHFLYINLGIFKEDALFPIALFFIYVILRIVCVTISISQSAKEN